MSFARELAERSHSGVAGDAPLRRHLLRGIPGYDDRAPDASEAGDAERRAALERVLAEAGRSRPADLGEADEVTLGCLTGLAEVELAELASASVEHTVTAMPFQGPADALGCRRPDRPTGRAGGPRLRDPAAP
jgi:hypothetical protein